jgi:hypothetical protein
MVSCCGKRPHLASIAGPAESACVGGMATPYAYIGLNNLANRTVLAWDGTNETVANNGGYVNWCTPAAGSCQPDQTPTVGEEFCAQIAGLDGRWFSPDCSLTTFKLIFEYDCGD